MGLCLIKAPFGIKITNFPIDLITLRNNLFHPRYKISLVYHCFPTFNGTLVLIILSIIVELNKLIPYRFYDINVVLHLRF